MWKMKPQREERCSRQKNLTKNTIPHLREDIENLMFRMKHFVKWFCEKIGVFKIAKGENIKQDWKRYKPFLFDLGIGVPYPLSNKIIDNDTRKEQQYE